MDAGPAAAAAAMSDERSFTPWAQAGWLSWDNWSPEQNFCLFAAALQVMLQPAVIVETGVGVGRLTSHLDLEACTYLGFESDPAWLHPPAQLGTPSRAQIASADLVILDSAPAYRTTEIAMWAEFGQPGSVCLVHDCGNEHPPRWTTHHEIRRAVEQTGLAGAFLRNPRGGWLAVHP